MPSICAEFPDLYPQIPTRDRAQLCRDRVDLADGRAYSGLAVGRLKCIRLLGRTGGPLGALESIAINAPLPKRLAWRSDPIVSRIRFGFLGEISWIIAWLLARLRDHRV